MLKDDRRITLVTRGSEAPLRDWDCSDDAPERLVFVNAFTVLKYALSVHSDATVHDVGRIIVDHATCATEFLDLLTILPHELTCDVLFIDGAHAFLSATGRGGDRVIYRLSAQDLAFYFETHGLVKSGTAITLEPPPRRVEMAAEARVN